MATRTDAIIRYFSRRGGPGRIVHNAASHLMRLIIERLRTHRLEDLMEFCADPDNLRPWLPTETDRDIFSEGLMEGLRNLAGRERQRDSRAGRETQMSMN